MVEGSKKKVESRTVKRLERSAQRNCPCRLRIHRAVDQASPVLPSNHFNVAQGSWVQLSSGGALLEASFQKIWRRMPRVRSASVAERCRRRTSRRIFSSVGAAERRFWRPLGIEFR